MKEYNKLNLDYGADAFRYASESSIKGYCELDAKITYELYKLQKKYERKQKLKKVLYYVAATIVAGLLFWLLKGVLGI